MKIGEYIQQQQQQQLKNPKYKKMNNQNLNTNLQSDNICYCHQTRIHSWTNLWDYSAHSVQFNALSSFPQSLCHFSLLRRPSATSCCSPGEMADLRPSDGTGRRFYLTLFCQDGWQAKALKKKKKSARWRDERRAAKIDKGEEKKCSSLKILSRFGSYVYRGDSWQVRVVATILWW